MPCACFCRESFVRRDHESNKIPSGSHDSHGSQMVLLPYCFDHLSDPRVQCSSNFEGISAPAPEAIRARHGDHGAAMLSKGVEGMHRKQHSQGEFQLPAAYYKLLKACESRSQSKIKT